MSQLVLPTLFEIAADALKTNPGWLDEAVDEHEAGRVTNTPPTTLSTMRVRGGGPPFVKRGARVSYIRRDLFQWLNARRRTSTSVEPTNIRRAEGSDCFCAADGTKGPTRAQAQIRCSGLHGRVGTICKGGSAPGNSS